MKYFIIGVDAGFRNTGLALFEIKKGKTIFVSGIVVETKKKSGKRKNVRVADDDVEGVKKITQDLKTFIRQYVDSDSMLIAAVEYPHGGSKSARAIRTMALVTGCVAAYFEIYGIPVQHVTPAEVKEAITKNRNATKEQIIKRVMRIIGERYNMDHIKKSKLEHFCDAVGAALWLKKYSDLYKLMIRESL